MSGLRITPWQLAWTDCRTPESISSSPKIIVLLLTSKKGMVMLRLLCFLYDPAKTKSGAVGEGIVGAEFRDFRLWS